jgi:endoglycosylceramidase
VRLGLIWKAVEPEPGHYDDAYLDRVAETASLLGGEGMHVLLDFHQDMLNERFNGEGFPDWAVQDDGIPARPDTGFPGNYFLMPALWRAYDHFWANDPGPGGVGLQDRYAAAWRHVAERFRDEPSVFGYDIFNEPYPGSRAALCALPGGNRFFDRLLGDFSRRVASAIRDVDRERFAFYEPNVLFDYGADTHHPALAGSATGFSFHVYCLAASPGLPSLRGGAQDRACRRQEQRVFTLAQRQAERNEETLLLSEFGATDDVHNIGRVADMADENMVSWQYWAYWNRDPCCERPEEGLVHDLARPPDGANVKWDKLDALARPYPRAVAGTPLAFGFDRASRKFQLSYLTDPVPGVSLPAAAETEVFVGGRHYPRGYRVAVTGAEQVSEDGAALLRLRASGESPEVTVLVTPD